MSVTTRLEARLGETDERRLLLLATFVPFTLFFAVVWGFPIAYALGMSLFENPTGSAQFVGLGNYVEVITGDTFGTALLNSVVYAVSSTVLSLLVGLGLALVVNGEIKGGNGLRTLMIFPYLLPTLVVSVRRPFLLAPNVGVRNHSPIDWGLIQSPVALF